LFNKQETLPVEPTITPIKNKIKRGGRKKRKKEEKRKKSKGGDTCNCTP
jgi:hypothetical protein